MGEREKEGQEEKEMEWRVEGEFAAGQGGEVGNDGKQVRAQKRNRCQAKKRKRKEKLIEMLEEWEHGDDDRPGVAQRKMGWKWKEQEIRMDMKAMRRVEDLMA